MRYRFGLFILSLMVFSSACLAVNSNITRQRTSAGLLKGEVSDVVITSQGTIELGRLAQDLVEEFLDVWSINSMVVSGNTVYIGTSPNGDVYQYSLGKFTRIYPEGLRPAVTAEDPNDANTVEAKNYLKNEHIFAMGKDAAGRLLVGLSGKTCKLMRYDSGRMETIFEPDDDTKYIFAIALDDSGAVYLGTGPEGKVYRLNASEAGAEVIYDSADKNILSLAAGSDGYVYAGSDSRGLVYKINPQSKTATVLYDTDQPEVTALLFGSNGQLYAAATSAKIVEAQNEFASKLPEAGKTEKASDDQNSSEQGQGDLRLKIPNLNKPDSAKKPSGSRSGGAKGPKPGSASFVYSINQAGYVTDVFSEATVFFDLVGYENQLLVGSGNKGRLYSIDPATESEAVIYEDKTASQITSLAVAGDDVYVGTANPAKLIKLENKFSLEGSYSSDLIDASQPALWGKLQIDADIPAGTKVMVSSRSGNVKDVNDPTFSDWTEPVQITEPVSLRCPVGRFCQYKLILSSSDGLKSPVVREVAVAHSLPNLAPRVEAVQVGRLSAPGKAGIFKIIYKAADANNDKLIYKIDFRKIGRTGWIELKDDNEAESYEWDGKTVEDGRYEIRVTASDIKDNTAATALTGTRVSDPVVVDNTDPFIKNASISKEMIGGKTVVTIKLTVRDELSAIDKLHYTVDSNSDWKGMVPDDLVYDTNEEDFTIKIEGLKPGEHVVTVRTSDDVGNTLYKTFDVKI